MKQLHGREGGAASVSSHRGGGAGRALLHVDVMPTATQLPVH